jgi:hypothetical protein
MSTNRIALAAVFAVAACSGRGDTSTVVPKPAASDGAAPAAKASPSGAGKAAAAGDAVERTPGTAHIGNLDTVVLASTGDAAITRDSFGSVRFWSAIDGSVEPQTLPVRGARSFSLARHPEGWTIAVVDSAQAGRTLRATGDGRGAKQGATPGATPGAIKMTELASLAPFDAIVEFHVLPGGEHVLALARDRTLRVYDDRGVELARLQKRSFRPDRLLLASDGAHGVAMSLSRDETGKTDGSLQRFTVSLGDKPAIALDGDAMSFATLLDTGTPMMDMSPDGKRFAYFNRNVTGQTTEWFIVVKDLETDTDKTVAAPIAIHLDPNLGFIGDREVLAYTSRGATAWVVDTDEDDRVVPRPAPPQHSSGTTPHDYAAGTFAAGTSQWLYVQKVADGDGQYLGYGALTPIGAAVSPSGKHAAWVSAMNEIFVEEIGSGPISTTMRALPNDWATQFGVQSVMFADDDLLFAVDRLGGIRLLSWRTNEVVAEAGASGGVRDAEYVPKLGLLRVTRHQNDTWIYELKGNELDGPHIVVDGGFRAGLLMPERDADPVLWTLDPQGVYRAYTLAELRRDRTKQEAATSTPRRPSSGGVQPTAIGRDGVRYFVGSTETGYANVRIAKDGIERELALSRINFSTVMPSPTGKTILVSFQDGAMLAYRTDTLELLWSFSTSVAASQILWSDDGKYVAVAASNGGAVLDASDGSVVSTRCAQAFEMRKAPPQSFFPSTTGASICER